MKWSALFSLDTGSRISEDIRQALNLGTTLTTRLWVSMFSMILGFQLLTGQPSLFSYAGYKAMTDTIPLHWWGGMFLVCGALMAWRIFTRKSRPIYGWISNILTCVAWTLLVVSRIWYIGFSAVISTSTVVCIMCAWLVVRTEATERDIKTA